MAELLKPKGSVKKQDNSAAIEEFAKQNATASNTEESNPLRESVTKLLLGNFDAPVDVPQKTTLGDIIKADKNRLGVFADYLKTPEAANLAGLIMGGQRYKDSWSDKLAKENEARFNRDRDTALAQQKQQNDLAENINREFNDMDTAQMQNDLARDKMAQDAEQFNQRLALDRESMRMGNALAQQRLNEAIRHNRAMESGNTTNGTNSTRDLQELKNQLDSFSSSFDKVDNPYRYRIAGGVSNKLNTLSNEEANFNAQRTLLFNQVARKLGGEKGVLSDQDIKRIDDSLPKLSDTKAQKMAKMESIYNLLDIRAGNSIGTSYNSAKQNSGLKVDKSAIQAEMKRRGLK